MNKKLVYQIEITLQTDGDFSFRKELLPPDFLTDDCREIIEFTEDTFKCNIYEKDMSEFGWKPGMWSKCVARNTFQGYISAIHVLWTHLYIWHSLLGCEEELTIHIFEDEWNSSNEFSRIIGGNYDGTEFLIRKINESEKINNEKQN